MHSAVEALRLLNLCQVAPKTFRPLSHTEASVLSDALSEDAESVAQTVIATLSEAILSISGSRFTWATVKLYYSVFYALKALTMLDGNIVFYQDSSPYLIKAKAGEMFKKRRGNSHSITFAEFTAVYKNDLLLSQPIGGDPPLVWIENLRNKASYSTAPFPDPLIPACFAAPSSRLRHNLSSYFAEQTPILPFQEDHAILAYPILVLRRLNFELSRRGKTVPIDAHYTTILANAGCDVAALKSLSAFVSV